MCDICFSLKKDINDKTRSPDQRCEALRLYRAHVGDQYRDRQALWSLQSVSCEALSDMGDVDSSVMTILIDGMDQSKFAIPRDPTLRSACNVCTCHVLLTDWAGNLMSHCLPMVTSDVMKGALSITASLFCPTVQPGGASTGLA